MDWLWIMASVATAFVVGAVMGRMLANEEIAKLREKLEASEDKLEVRSATLMELRRDLGELQSMSKEYR